MLYLTALIPSSLSSRGPFMGRLIEFSQGSYASYAAMTVDSFWSGFPQVQTRQVLDFSPICCSSCIVKDIYGLRGAKKSPENCRNNLTTIASSKIHWHLCLLLVSKDCWLPGAKTSGLSLPCFCVLFWYQMKVNGSVCWILKPFCSQGAPCHAEEVPAPGHLRPPGTRCRFSL